jgi:hypothetical protein
MAFALFTVSLSTYGQKQVKSYNESFLVTDATVLDIDTSHADLEFETWDKDQIQIEATIEVEGMTQEDADNYFKNEGFDIVGNSQKVSIRTGSENTFFLANRMGGLNGMRFEFPEVPAMHMDSLLHHMTVLPEIAEMAAMTPMPPMPPVPAEEFDYAAFKKDGEKYLKKWQKKFSKGFDKEYEKKMAEWSAQMDERRAEMEEKRAEMEEKRETLLEKRMEAQEKLMEKRMEENAKHMEQRAKQQAERAMAMQDRNEALAAARKEGLDRRNSTEYRMFQTDSLRSAPNIFYFSTDSENKNYKVKKTIKIRMPKATKIQMNVRHGEVKLAENTRNIKATLSYASLLAATIEGDGTTIVASYSPVSVQKWNYGQLTADYSESIALKEVLNLRLSASSSDVVIDRLVNTATIKNDFGPLRINAISKDFKSLDISLKNAELVCKLPTSSFTINVNGINSEFTGPASLSLQRTNNLNSFVSKGYYLAKNSDRAISINSKYGDIQLQ